MKGKMKVGNRVVMKESMMPRSKFRTGVVKALGSFGNVKIVRDNYQGHEYTWWWEDEWKVIK